MFFKAAVPYVRLSTKKPVKNQGAKKVRVTFLGSSGVGKTSIVQQFICNYFRDDYTPTGRRRCYQPSVVLDDRVYDIKISDCPRIDRFPASALGEWSSDYRGYGLRKASAYVLVFDVTDADSFAYIKQLREQIVKSRDADGGAGSSSDLPILVVANKCDLLYPESSEEEGSDMASSPCDSGLPDSESPDSGSPDDEDCQPCPEPVDYYSIVRQQWKCAYLECSAKLDWHITAVFRELLCLVDSFHQCGGASRVPLSLTAKDTLFQTACSIS